MNYLLFTLEYPPFKGGTEKYYSDLVKYFPEPEKIFVLHNNDKKLLAKFIWPHWLPAIFKLRRAIKKNKIGHVLVGQVLPLGTIALLVSKFINIKYSVFLHGTDLAYALKHKRKTRIAVKVLGKAELVICNSSYVAEKAHELLGDKHQDKIKFVNPGVEPSISNYQLPISKLQKKYNLENKFILFSIGRLIKRKGFDMVIRALPDMLEEAPSVVYFIAGAGPDEEYLKRIVKQHPKRVQERIVFLGKISDVEKEVWLRLCDIFLSPGRDEKGDVEGFGIVFLEAALAGKPVLAGRSGGVEDAVVDYETGILVDPESVSEIADGVIELYRNRELRIELGNAGMRRAAERFNSANQVRKIYNLLNL